MINPSVKDLLETARAWADTDDWNVEGINVSTLEYLAARLAEGHSVEVVSAHAKHTGRYCCPLWAPSPY